MYLRWRWQGTPTIAALAITPCPYLITSWTRLADRAVVFVCAEAAKPRGGARETSFQSIGLNPEAFTISAQRCVSAAISSANSDGEDSTESRDSLANPSLNVLDRRTSRIAS